LVDAEFVVGDEPPVASLLRLRQQQVSQHVLQRLVAELDLDDEAGRLLAEQVGAERMERNVVGVVSLVDQVE
jgi:hypothetical protein